MIYLRRIHLLDNWFGNRPYMNNETILVLGLGRFGSAAARQLQELGATVVAVDKDPSLVSRLSSTLPHVVILDVTASEALAQLGLENVTCAIVGLTNLEASVVACLTLKEARVPEVWAKASSTTHSEILQRIGIDHVVYPEASTGRRVARAAADHMLDYFEFDDGFALARINAPAVACNRPVAETQMKTRNVVTIVGIKCGEGAFLSVQPDTIVHPGDQLIISGSTDAVERFARLNLPSQ